MAMAMGSRNEVRMILLGKTGTGKSSFGNTIIGVKQFQSGMSPNGMSTECKCASRFFDGKKLFVVDTPGFCDPNIERKDILDEVGKAYEVTALPGPHAFLLIIEPRRFTRDEAQAVNDLTELFGANAFKHTIIIFTHADSFDPEEGTIKTYLDQLKPDNALKKLLDQCQQRYLVVNNKGTETEKTQVIQTLLEMIASMIAKNNGQLYTTTKFDEVAKFNAEEAAKGNYNPINPDGSITLHPKVKEIIVEGFLRRTIGKKVVH